MLLTTYFDHFLRSEVNLNPYRRDRIRPRVEALVAYLTNHEDLDPMLTGDWARQGSWAHATIVKPEPGDEFDADIQIEFIEQDDPEFRPKDYLRALRAALRTSEVYKDKLTRKDRCVRVAYLADDEEFHVDIVPVIRRAGYPYPAIVNFRDDKFETTDPEEFNAWFDKRNEWAQGALRRTIRLLKYLRNDVGSDPKSVILTILVAQTISEFDDPDAYWNTAQSFLTLLGRLNDYLQARPTKPSIVDPSCPIVDFNHRLDDDTYRIFRDRVETWNDKAQAAAEEDHKLKAASLWQDLFGPQFVAPPSATIAASADDRSLRGPEEEFIDDHVTVNVGAYNVEIDGRMSKHPVFDPSGGWLKRSGRRVRPKQQITFSVTECNVPEPYEVWWKVRNVGPEAIRRNMERGEITKNQPTKTEPAEFQGDHWVECYIVKSDECVALTRLAVPISAEQAT